MPVGSQEFLMVGAALVETALERFGRVRFRALGTSMMPTIRSGDVLHVCRCTSDELRLGDIVLMAGAGGLRAHRFVGRRSQDGREVVVTRGDAHCRTDAFDPRERVLGRIFEITRANPSSTVSLECSIFDRLRALAGSEFARIAAVIRDVARQIVRRAMLGDR